MHVAVDGAEENQVREYVYDSRENLEEIFAFNLAW